jgi:hypothetical protein
MLAQFAELNTVGLDAEQLQTLPALAEITTLVLEDASDKSLEILSELSLPKLKYIYLVGTRKTFKAASREALKRALPNCDVK